MAKFVEQKSLKTFDEFKDWITKNGNPWYSFDFGIEYSEEDFKSMYDSYIQELETHNYDVTVK